MTQQPSLVDAKSVLNSHRDTYLSSAWDYLGLELRNALESIPDDPAVHQDREAARSTFDSWTEWPDGWKALGSAGSIDDPERANLLRVFGDLIKA